MRQNYASKILRRNLDHLGIGKVDENVFSAAINAINEVIEDRDISYDYMFDLSDIEEFRLSVPQTIDVKRVLGALHGAEIDDLNQVNKLIKMGFTNFNR